jgi:hypothetical protein
LLPLTPARAPTRTSPTSERVDRMTGLRPPLDEGKLDLVRAFLRKHFPGCELIDRFDFEATAQRFTLEPGRAARRTLLVPRETLEDSALGSLLSERLVEALKRAGGRRVTLTIKGIRY